jgi:hypothetical protein
MHQFLNIIDNLNIIETNQIISKHIHFIIWLVQFHKQYIFFINPIHIKIYIFSVSGIPTLAALDSNSNTPWTLVTWTLHWRTN